MLWWDRSASVVPLALAVLLGCSDSGKCAPNVVTSDQKCSTTLDCVEAGFKSLSCINGRCARGCLRDADCDLGTPGDQDANACEAPSPSQLVFICESQLCMPGCPDVPCGAGQSCVEGRCAFFFESFELPAGQDFATPKSLGWNDRMREIENRETTIVFSGSEGCSRGDERCAGPAAHGAQFVALERVPTPERGTPALGVTCRACACCLECRLNPPANASLAQIPSCPGANASPASLMCSSEIPAVCNSICAQCDGCMASSASPGSELLACERQAAGRTCSGCSVYDRCTSNCDALRPACFACRDAIQCELDTPGSATCRSLEQTCDAQGADGCYSTPIARPRSQLTEEEQALESMKIPGVAGQDGRLVIQFEYVPFDIREVYRRVVQGRPPSEWPIEKQEVVVQLCGGSCDDPRSWVDGMSKSGAIASFPPASQRRNGLSFGGQSSIDWQGNRIEVEIPESLRTPELRFRFLPRLENDARVGLDNILVRRRP